LYSKIALKPEGIRWSLKKQKQTFAKIGLLLPFSLIARVYFVCAGFESPSLVALAVPFAFLAPFLAPSLQQASPSAHFLVPPAIAEGLMNEPPSTSSAINGIKFFIPYPLFYAQNEATHKTNSTYFYMPLSPARHAKELHETVHSLN